MLLVIRLSVEAPLVRPLIGSTNDLIEIKETVQDNKPKTIKKLAGRGFMTKAQFH
jgi:hypothetical protein